MFHSDIKNIKKEEVKLQPTNPLANNLTPSSSGMSSSSGKFPSLEELCNSKPECSDVFTSTPIIELVCFFFHLDRLLLYITDAYIFSKRESLK